MEKNRIKSDLLEMRNRRMSEIANFGDGTSVEEYKSLVKVLTDGKEVWSDAFQTAILENSIIKIPKKSTPYYIDKTITIPSSRHIEAEEGAVVSQLEDVKVLMFRNEHTQDGTKLPINTELRDCNISINGGRWEEAYRARAGYGKSGMYDENRSFFGVSTCMLFNNIDNLTLTNMTFAHTAGFAVQLGDMENGVFENIKFESCYADGLHFNGNSKNIYVKNISGQVGDDLVALNMYDWQNSSVNFGPGENIYCENLELSTDSRCKAMRIEMGIYFFEDGSSVDCSINNLYICGVKGINTFKLYYQTPPYDLGTEPERGAVGSGDNIFFENIDVDLNAPVDRFPEYLNSDPIRGTIAAFEMGSNIGKVSFENINVKLYKDRFPMSFFVCQGPKSIIQNGREIFDPYLSSTVEELEIKNVFINGASDWENDFGIKEISFNDINSDGNSTAKGEIKKITRL